MSYKLLDLVLSLTCLVVSYAGNRCTIMVMRKSPWRKRAATTKLLFCVLAVTDMCYMSFRVIDGQFTEKLPDNIQKVCTLVDGSLVNYSTSVLVVISVERFVCVFCPLKVHVYFSLRNCKIVLILLFFITAAWNVLYVLWVMTVERFVVASVLVDFALPFAMITFTTIAIAVNIKKPEKGPIQQICCPSKKLYCYWLQLSSFLFRWLMNHIPLNRHRKRMTQIWYLAENIYDQSS